MQRITGLIRDHWTGRLSPAAALLGPLLAVSLILLPTLRHLNTATALPTTLLLLTAITVLIWQVTGILRTMERHPGEGIAWVGYGATSILALVSVTNMISLALPPDTPRSSLTPKALTEGLEVQGNAAILRGSITLGHFSALRALVDGGHPPATLTLHSQGGSVHAARGLARLVEENGIHTSVSGECLSACTLIFIAGSRRDLAPGATLGFHAYDTGGGTNRAMDLFVDVNREQQKDLAFFRRRGVTEPFLARIYTAAPTTIWRPARRELVTAGIIRD